MKPLRRGRLIARLAETEADVTRAQALRWQAFRARTAPQGPANGEATLDRDAFDARCLHLLVEDADHPDHLVACARALPLASGAEVGTCYTAQYYDLARLSRHPGPMLEVGRFCTQPGNSNPEVLRMVLGGLARLAESRGVSMLFGASSFVGTDPAPFERAFAHLARHHLAPPRWMPAPKAREVLRYAQSSHSAAPCLRGPGASLIAALGTIAERTLGALQRALAPMAGVRGFGTTAGALAAAAYAPLLQQSMVRAPVSTLAPAAPPPAQIPPLLRSYLAMGGWVSDHAVIDRDLETLHVFTALEISAIPPGRARLLRALAADQG